MDVSVNYNLETEEEGRTDHDVRIRILELRPYPGLLVPRLSTVVRAPRAVQPDALRVMVHTLKQREEREKTPGRCIL